MTVDPDALREKLLKYTRTAFHLLPPVSAPSILDAGCGTGVPTLELARLAGGEVLAVDTDGAALARLREKIVKRGLQKRVRALQCSFTELPAGEGPFDIVWAEGSVAGIGITAALDLLGRQVKKGGFLVIHDDEGDGLEKALAARAAGWDLRAFFVLPGSLWWEQYYRPMQAALRKATAARPPYRISQLREEVERVRAEPQRYGSAYFIMSRRESA